MTCTCTDTKYTYNLHKTVKNKVFKLTKRQKSIAFTGIWGYIKATKTIKKVFRNIGGTIWYL